VQPTILAAAQGGLEGAALGPFGFAVAFAAGVVSFASPCVLPLAPGYLAYVSGLTGRALEEPTAEERRRALAGIGLFILGLATVFTALGASASALGGFLLDHFSFLTRIAGAFVIVMGLSFLGVLRLVGRLVRQRLGKIPKLGRLVSKVPLLGREWRVVQPHKIRAGLSGAYPLGCAFGLGWTPCIGPVLGVILTLAAQEGNTVRGAFLLFVYSLGLGLPFFLLGLGMVRGSRTLGWLRRRAVGLERTSGAVMVAIGILLVSNKWNDVIAPLRRLINRWAPPI
jgi:cytochrome c-type biogenesis protein